MGRIKFQFVRLSGDYPESPADRESFYDLDLVGTLIEMTKGQIHVPKDVRYLPLASHPWKDKSGEMYCSYEAKSPEKLSPLDDWEDEFEQYESPEVGLIFSNGFLVHIVDLLGTRFAHVMKKIFKEYIRPDARDVDWVNLFKTALETYERVQRERESAGL